MILAPGFPMRKWRKIEIIRLFNGQPQRERYGAALSEHRLANRRLDMVVCDIAALLSGG
jgi:hypothetical protein